MNGPWAPVALAERNVSDENFPRAGESVLLELSAVMLEGRGRREGGGLTARGVPRLWGGGRPWVAGGGQH